MQVEYIFERCSSMRWVSFITPGGLTITTVWLETFRQSLEACFHQARKHSIRPVHRWEDVYSAVMIARDQLIDMGEVEG